MVIHRRVIVSAEVYAELRETSAWLRERNPAAAARFRHMADKALRGLAQDAERHARAHEAEDIGMDVRRVLFGTSTKWRLYFVVEGDEVHVLSLLHGARDDWAG